MGHNSNRPLNRDEKVARFAKKIAEARDPYSFEFQMRTGAQIRGTLGVRKGNEFIEAVRNATKKW